MAKTKKTKSEETVERMANGNVLVEKKSDEFVIVEKDHSDDGCNHDAQVDKTEHHREEHTVVVKEVSIRLIIPSPSNANFITFMSISLVESSSLTAHRH